jgi:hypothetical protein
MKTLKICNAGLKNQMVFEVKNFIYYRNNKEYALDRQIEQGRLRFIKDGEIDFEISLSKIFHIIFSEQRYIDSTTVNDYFRKENTKFTINQFMCNRIHKNLFNKFYENFNGENSIELDISDDLFLSHSYGLTHVNLLRKNKVKKEKSKIVHLDKIGTEIEIDDLVIGCRDNNLHITTVKKLCPLMLLLNNNVYVYKKETVVIKKHDPSYEQFNALSILIELRK